MERLQERMVSEIDRFSSDAPMNQWLSAFPQNVERMQDMPSRAVREYLAALDRAGEAEEDRKTPKVVSLSDPASAWTAKANKRVG